MYWFTSMALFFSMSLTIFYDLKLSTVQTGGIYYGLATIPVVGYSFLEMFMPHISMSPFFMLFVHFYLMAYLAGVIGFYMIYKGQLACQASFTYLSDYAVVTEIKGYLCNTVAPEY